MFQCEFGTRPETRGANLEAALRVGIDFSKRRRKKSSTIKCKMFRQKDYSVGARDDSKITRDDATTMFSVSSILRT
jgi:hypothetical protein